MIGLRLQDFPCLFQIARLYKDLMFRERSNGIPCIDGARVLTLDQIQNPVGLEQRDNKVSLDEAFRIGQQGEVFGHSITFRRLPVLTS